MKFVRAEDFDTTTLKTDFTPKDHKTVARRLKHFFQKHYNFEPYDYFGLPFTSSSQFAGLWNTNVNWYLKANARLRGFALTNDNVIIAVCTNPEVTGSEIYYRLERPLIGKTKTE